MASSDGSPRPSQAPGAEPDGGGLGELLRRARERRGVTLEQIADETKIPRRHLEALEQDNLAAVPGGFYRRAQVRVFAQAVNLDRDLAVTELERSLGRPAVSAPAPDAPAAHGPTSSRHQLLIIIGIGVAAAVFASLAGRPPLLGQDGPGGRATDSPRPGVPQAPEPPAEPVLAAPPDSLVPVVPPSTGSAGALAATTPVPEAPAPAVPPADAAVRTEFTELVVTTDPPGARVTVDGIGWGTAPVSIRFLPAGSKRIRVIKDGYRGEERAVTLADNRRTVLDIQLQSAP